MRLFWALTICFSPVSARADAMIHDPVWIGIWAAEPAWCAFKDRVGSHNPAPISLGPEYVSGYENTCKISRIEQVGDMRAWNLHLNCQSEGSEYSDETLVALEDDNTLWRFYTAGAPVRFSRCKE